MNRLKASESLRLFEMRSRLRNAWAEKALTALLTLDSQARFLGASELIVSCELVRHLKDLLPEEHEACRFESVAQQDAAATMLIERFGNDLPVILHLGTGPIAFSTSLRAAWFAWEQFYETSCDAHNPTLYPRTMEWYVFRAGPWFVYPMDCSTSDKPQLTQSWLGF